MAGTATLLTLDAVRPAAAAVLRMAAADDVNVLEDLADSVTPPAVMLAWDDPMLVAGVNGRVTMGPCEYTGRLRVICVAARLDPGAGGDELERLVAYVLGAMRADTYTWTLDRVTAPRQADQSGVSSLIAEVAYVVQTAI